MLVQPRASLRLRRWGLLVGESFLQERARADTRPGPVLPHAARDSSDSCPSGTRSVWHASRTPRPGPGPPPPPHSPTSTGPGPPPPPSLIHVPGPGPPTPTPALQKSPPLKGSKWPRLAVETLICCDSPEATGRTPAATLG